MVNVVHLKDLPSDMIYIDLDREYKEELIQSTLFYSGTLINLGKELSLKINKYNSCKTLESMLQGKKIRLSTFFKIIKYLKKQGYKVSWADIERKITLIAAKRNTNKRPRATCVLSPRLPFKFDNIAGAIVVSSLLFDGGIDSRTLPHYHNYEKELRDKVKNAFIGVFGTIENINSDVDGRTQIYFPRVIGRVLVYCLGMKQGRKTLINPTIPKFIWDADTEIKAAFLQQAFDDEGYVTKSGIGIKLAVKGDKQPPLLLLDIKKLLKQLNIYTTKPHHREVYVTKDGVKCSKWDILITNKRNLKKFREVVNFSLERKKKTLDKTIKGRRFEEYSRKIVNNIMLNACIKLQEEKGFITSHDLAIEIERTQIRAKQVISKFRKKGILKLLHKRRGPYGSKYVINYKKCIKPKIIIF